MNAVGGHYPESAYAPVVEERPKVRTLGDYAEVLKRRWIYPVLILPAVMLLSVFLAYVQTPIYESTATIMLEASSIPEQLVQTTVNVYADQQFELVRRQVMTPAGMASFFDKVDPYPDPSLSLEDKASLVADYTWVERVDPVTLEPLNESTAFSLHYGNPDPVIAARVTEELAQLFLDYNRKTRTQRAEEAYDFLSSQSAQLEQTVKALDERIAEFKRRNPSALPEDAMRNEASLDRTQRDYDDVMAQVRAAEQRESSLSVQLSQLNPTLVGAVTDPRNNLADLQAKLAEAQQRYTPDHPTVKQLQRAIAKLLETSGPGAMEGVVPDNPEYLRVRGELESARRDLAALRAQAARTRNDLGDYRSRLMRAPGLEPEYQQLQRERQVAQEQLEEARRKLRDAYFAQQFEAEQRGARYSLIRAPSVSDSPSSPNRLGYLLLGLVIGSALGFGLAIVVDVADAKVRGMEDVRLATQAPILAAVPLMMNADQLRRRRTIWVGVAAAYLVATLIVAWTVMYRSAGEPGRGEVEIAQSS
jgi:polysaccharide chain length determinant protein (PEP-CTERM system associated)